MRSARERFDLTRNLDFDISTDFSSVSFLKEAIYWGSRLDHIEADSIPEQEECDKEPASEKISPGKEKTNLSQYDADLKNERRIARRSTSRDLFM